MLLNDIDWWRVFRGHVLVLQRERHAVEILLQQLTGTSVENGTCRCGVVGFEKGWPMCVLCMVSKSAL